LDEILQLPLPDPSNFTKPTTKKRSVKVFVETEESCYFAAINENLNWDLKGAVPADVHEIMNKS